MRQQREKETAEYREQRLVAVLDCSHLLLIVAIGIAHAMLATQSPLSHDHAKPV